MEYRRRRMSRKLKPGGAQLQLVNCFAYLLFGIYVCISKF